MRRPRTDAPPTRARRVFGTNRNSPEAKANQLKWAKQMMDLEVPERTADGSQIVNKEDFIAKYIVSEKEKFGRDIDEATAEAEVDQWLLEQATNASSKTSGSDLALGLAVFVITFGGGLYFAQQ